MKLLIDDADLLAIKKIYDYYPIDGVTTNPSILAKTKRAPYQVLKEIREFIGDEAELHVQVIGETCIKMVEDAKSILRELGENTYIKIPVNQEGLKAIKVLKEGDKRINITATAIYTTMQAYLAAKAGADYVAPYVNRIDNLGFDGVLVAKDIHNLFIENNYKCQVLAASFKNTKQVLELAKSGVGAATVGVDTIEGLLKNDAVDKAIMVFSQDFEMLCGKNKTMSNL
jgi:Transaldolase